MMMVIEFLSGKTVTIEELETFYHHHELPPKQWFSQMMFGLLGALILPMLLAGILITVVVFSWYMPDLRALLRHLDVNQVLIWSLLPILLSHVVGGYHLTRLPMKAKTLIHAYPVMSATALRVCFIHQLSMFLFWMLYYYLLIYLAASPNWVHDFWWVVLGIYTLAISPCITGVFMAIFNWRLIRILPWADGLVKFSIHLVMMPPASFLAVVFVGLMMGGDLMSYVLSWSAGLLPFIVLLAATISHLKKLLNLWRMHEELLGRLEANSQVKRALGV